MAAYRYGDKLKKTHRYKLGEVLSRTSYNLLFLTATPHKGDAENFRLFLDLLVPGFFSSAEMVEESLKNRDNPLFIRRLKEDLTDFDGKPIFTRRFPRTIKFRLSYEERELYEEVTRYVVEQYNKLEREASRNVAFALMMLQSRMASSTYALLRSLKRRRERLDSLRCDGRFEDGDIFVEIDALEDMEERQIWEKEHGSA